MSCGNIQVDSEDPRARLGVQPGASEQVNAGAYRVLVCCTLHMMGTEEEESLSISYFQKIQDAYDQLRVKVNEAHASVIDPTDLSKRMKKLFGKAKANAIKGGPALTAALLVVAQPVGGFFPTHHCCRGRQLCPELSGCGSAVRRRSWTRVAQRLQH